MRSCGVNRNDKQMCEDSFLVYLITLFQMDWLWKEVVMV